MTGPLTFEIDEAPVPKKRPRVTWAHGRPHAYTPTGTRTAERSIREHVEAQLGDAWVPLEGPVAVSITAYLRLPQRVPRRLRATALPASRPDADNLAKAGLDALTSGRVWLDDAQVVTLVAKKRYAVDRAPGWVITVEPMSLEVSA
jgi:Holliday junction resolvase RusA-like endonuclease